MTPSTPWGKVAAAGAATLVGNGLARFAYSPLLPVLIAQGWFAPGAAAYLGAANLLGYLGGALAARRVAARLGTRPALRLCMALAAASLLACCAKMPFAWFFVWRLTAGLAAGVLMIVAPTAILPLVPAGRRGLAGGLVFTGVGLGIAASGTIVPLLLSEGLTVTWLTLGGISAVLTLATWRSWPDVTPAPPLRATRGGHQARFMPGVLPVCVNYGLCAVGMVPHMIFLVDYVARGQGRGIAAGSLEWSIFGMGALFGAVAVGRLADAIGARAATVAVLGSQLLCVGALAFVTAPLVAGVAAFVSGLCLSGITTAVLSRINEATGAELPARQRGWTQATVGWGIGQASAAYGLAWLYARTGGYTAMLATAAAALSLALVIEAVTALRGGGKA